MDLKKRDKNAFHYVLDTRNDHRHINHHVRHCIF